ncbi:hypothetical protein OJ997_29340 [Solirubrobacter phytolaccae]|uniref:SMP-30/Gluconolactonase/LRE-like region domain-containing protein n=1 Tax=Solirubrobacter phytolaccae TaxID=1404360 RepID=A0A9X3SE34_9ACTN|nr:hypothetical protein [Solirubrobacter phytolaccae]MDA0184445.1 hypothetical protein [Solirubrobacter phytolaccae]
MRALCTIIFALALAAPAHAADSLRVGIKSSVNAVVPGPDGGAWVAVSAYPTSRVVRIAPDGRLRSTPLDYLSLGNGGVFGPDGQAWFLGGTGITRVDAAGSASNIPMDRVFASAFATGADGTVWVSGETVRRVAVDGTVTSTPLAVPGCAKFRASAITRAADGAMWLADPQCGFVRVASGAAPVVVANPRLDATKLVADLQGGVWFFSYDGPGGHIDAAGRVTPLERLRAYDVAVAADGSAYFATGKCFLERVSPAGAMTRVPTAVPSWHVAFDPAGGLWLASAARVQHTTLGAPAGGCDDKPPVVRITPDPSKPVSLATLRRQRGFKLTVREAFAIEGVLIDSDADDSIGRVNKAVSGRRGGTLRLPMSARAIRRVGQRSGQRIVLDAGFRDREGNFATVTYELRARR